MKNQYTENHNNGPILILPDVRSVLNVGSLFRTSDAIGIKKIYLVGYTPTPIDRFGKKRSDFAKTALGAEDSVLWEYKKSLLPLIKKLKKDGYTIVAIEQAQQSVDYKKLKVQKERTVLVVGNEVTGLSQKIISSVDHVVEIPMKGMKESLNVTIAAGIVMFRLFDK